MLQRGPGHGLGLLTGIALGTIRRHFTGAATERPLGAVVQAGGLDAGEADAVGAGGAGDAEAGDVRHADEDHVRSSPHLLAAPPRGAVLHAGVGADRISQVIHTPSGEAILVVAAGLPDTARARLAAREHVPAVHPGDHLLSGIPGVAGLLGIRGDDLPGPIPASPIGRTCVRCRQLDR